MIEVHPIALKIPPMSVEEYTAFRDDIAKNGLLSPITLFEGKKLDGIHRARACRELGIEPRYETYEGSDPLGFVLSKNLHRRSITAAQRRELAKEYMQEYPELSDRAIAEATKTHPNTVGDIRAEIAEEHANIHGVYNHDSEDEAPATEPAPAPPPRIERGLKKDGTPRKARGRKPGTVAAPKEPPKPEFSDDPTTEWVTTTQEFLATRTNDAIHAIVAMIAEHRSEVQAKIDDFSRRSLVSQFAWALGLKLAND